MPIKIDKKTMLKSFPLLFDLSPLWNRYPNGSQTTEITTQSIQAYGENLGYKLQSKRVSEPFALTIPVATTSSKRTLYIFNVCYMLLYNNYLTPTDYDNFLKQILTPGCKTYVMQRKLSDILRNDINTISPEL